MIIIFLVRVGALAELANLGFITAHRQVLFVNSGLELELAVPAFLLNMLLHMLLPLVLVKELGADFAFHAVSDAVALVQHQLRASDHLAARVGVTGSKAELLTSLSMVSSLRPYLNSSVI